MFQRVLLFAAAAFGGAMALSSIAWAQTGAQAVPGPTTVEMYVAVWSPDGALASDATVVTSRLDGSTVKADTLPNGVHYQGGLDLKTVLEVEHPSLGRALFEITFPDHPRLWVDVAFNGPASAEFTTIPPLERPDQELLGEPDNDLCENAIGPLGVPSLTSGTTSGATIDSEFPFCGTSITSGGVWYTVIGTGNTMTATTCNMEFDYDTKISVYCGTCDDPFCVGGNDDDCDTGASGLLSTVNWCSQGGVEYLILVHGFSDGEGDFDLEILDDGVACTAEVQCLPIGACCLPGGECVDGLTESECAALGGEYQGDGAPCAGGIVEYTVEVCENLFFDIGNLGTDGPIGDDEGIVVPIGFDFRFYGGVHDQVGMSTNGYLTFGPELEEYENTSCPDPTEPNDAIFPLWDDLEVDGPGQTFYATLGVAPNRQFIAQWTNVREHEEDVPAATFQAILFETSNTIEFRYLDLIEIPSFPGDVTVGVENETGTAATCVPDSDLMSFGCLLFTPVELPPVQCCNSGTPLEVYEKISFSYLEGSEFDLDGLEDGVLTLDGLHIFGVGGIEIDVSPAIFIVNGLVLLEDAGCISPPSPTPFDSGPDIFIYTCDSVVMRDFSRIRALGTNAGGTVTICADDSVIMHYISGIEATPEVQCPGRVGGEVSISCGESFRMFDIWTYVTVHAEEAGNIYVAACGEDFDTVRLEGRLIASGWGRQGYGGIADLTASFGGMWIPGVNHVLATGRQGDGAISLFAFLGIFPPGAPIVSPAPTIVTGVPGPQCACLIPGPDEE